MILKGKALGILGMGCVNSVVRVFIPLWVGRVKVAQWKRDYLSGSPVAVYSVLEM
jgi:branched-subunit amino acid transport protein